MTIIQKPLGKRLAVVQVLLIIWMAAIGGKLVWLQVKQHDWLVARAGRQHQASIELSPTRGVIYDRNGNELARSVEAKSLYAAPAEIKDPDRAANELSELLAVDREALYKRLTSAQVLVAVKRRLADREVAEVEKLGWQGLTFVNEMKRHYITGQSAAHVLGFVDTDERAGGGIELAYDKLVRGRGGNLLLDVDAFNKSYNHSVEESVPGANVTLTIDLVIQHHVEKALAEAVRASRARGGTVVIVRPATGEILALASYPTFDPNKVGDSTDTQRQNRAVETAFEPGSIFKMVTYSAAIEENLIRPDTRIDCGGGQIRIADRIIRDHPYGVLTAAQALAKSSNVAAIKVGMMLGNDRFARYIEKFGFGRRTGIELPAESRGLFRPASEWTPVTIGSIPMGHEIAVTAVQAAAAYACIANGGEWLKPHMVSKVTTAYGDVIDEHQPEKRQVVSQATAATLKAMLEGVVMQGTGKAAKLGGYRAAGKTGTAQKVDEKTGRYSNTRHVASFAGFAPVENPEIACVVSIDEPVGAHHGGTVAAPVFARVVADALRVLGVAPEGDPHSMLADDVHTYDLPDMVTDAVPPAPEGDEDLRPSIDIAAEPASDDPASNRFGSIVVPDLVGLGIREAVAICASRGLKMKASGDGVVAIQNPSPGSLVARDTTCRVKLSRDYSRKEPADAAASSQSR